MKLLACCLLFSGAAAVAQLPSTPSIEMGVWQLGESFGSIKPGESKDIH